MDLNELDPITKKKVLKNLDELSIEALGEYVEELELEINRVKKAIEQKEVALDGANTFFKS